MLRHGIAIGDDRIGCRFVADTGLVAALPPSLSATPNQQCARELNQLATWPLVVET